jgi:hypothetical protein
MENKIVRCENILNFSILFFFYMNSIEFDRIIKQAFCNQSYSAFITLNLSNIE